MSGHSAGGDSWFCTRRKEKFQPTERLVYSKEEFQPAERLVYSKEEFQPAERLVYSKVRPL